MSHITNIFETLTLTDNTLTPSPSMSEMAGVEASKSQKCDANNTNQGWTKMIVKKRKTDMKSTLEKLHEPPTASASPRSLVQNKLAASWTIWDHQSNQEIPKGADWNSSMRKVAIVSTVEEFWVNWSYIPLLR